MAKTLLYAQTFNTDRGRNHHPLDCQHSVHVLLKSNLTPYVCPTVMSQCTGTPRSTLSHHILTPSTATFSLNVLLPHLPQTSSTSRSCRPCSSRWRRRSACVCSTAGGSFASTCRLASCGRTTRWACAAPSMATFKMTSCKCVPADLWPLPRPPLTHTPSNDKKSGHTPVSEAEKEVMVKCSLSHTLPL